MDRDGKNQMIKAGERAARLLRDLHEYSGATYVLIEISSHPPSLENNLMGMWSTGMYFGSECILTPRRVWDINVLFGLDLKNCMKARMALARSISSMLTWLDFGLLFSTPTQISDTHQPSIVLREVEARLKMNARTRTEQCSILARILVDKRISLWRNTSTRLWDNA